MDRNLKVPARRASLRGLRTFCVAAKHLSFRLAADELAVTASAVSHQVKNLEEEIGKPLFVREVRSLALTETGAALYRELAPLVQALDDAVNRHREPGSIKTLRISAQPFFASEFFVPRLEDFSSRHPNIEIEVDTSDESSERHPTSVDVSIRLFREPPTDLYSHRLFPLRLIPACSPDFLDRFDGDVTASSFPIIVHSSRGNAWDRWQKSTGIRLAPPSRVIRVDSMIAVARAAERGIGAALVPVPLSENWFRYGALTKLFDEEVVMDDTYYFVTRPELAEGPEVGALRSWVVDEFADI